MKNQVLVYEWLRTWSSKEVGMRDKKDRKMEVGEMGTLGPVVRGAAAMRLEGTSQRAEGEGT